jgi:uncharacterized protein (DUF1800 family)
MLRAVLAKRNVATAGGEKLRRPGHFAAALLRGLCAEIPQMEVHPLLQHLEAMGHSPFDWPSPDGYPDTADAWGSSLLPRWRFASDLLAGHVQGVELNVVRLTNQLQGTVDGLARRIDRSFLGQSLSSAEIDAVQRFLDGKTPNWATLSAAIALAASMPGYQWY